MIENKEEYDMKNIIEGKENLHTNATNQTHNKQTTELIRTANLISFRIQWNNSISTMKSIPRAYKITVRILL